MRSDADRVVEQLRAAAEPTRLRVLALLAREELAVAELALALGHSQPRVSRHLKLLADAGLVERFPDGAWVFYRLRQDAPQRALVQAVLDRLEAAAGDGAQIAAAAGLGGDLARDLTRLEAVRLARAEEADAYFARNAAHWNEIRSLHVAEDAVEAAILRAAGEGAHRRLIDLGTGTGRMLTLLAGETEEAVGLDLSRQMLNIARAETDRAGVGARVRLRHGDIQATGLPSASADLVVIHRVLHYLADPAGAITEAARLLAPAGRLLVIDFAPHDLEQLRSVHQHRRLGFSDEEIGRMSEGAGLRVGDPVALAPSPGAPGLTVKIWRAERPASPRRAAA